MSSNERIKIIVKRLKIIYKNMSIEEILRERGIVVCPISGCNISKGAYKMYDDIQYIFINTDLSPEERLETLTHELGHSILHPDVDTYELKSCNCTYFLNKYENQADLFAAEFLLHDNIIENICGCFCEVGDGKSIYDIANDYKVTAELVLIKLSNLDKSKLNKFDLTLDCISVLNTLNC